MNYVVESCRRRGGHGCYARECPTRKGKGRGEKGKGKGKGGDIGKEGKGKGKGGFGGECWVCGEKGHSSYACPGLKKEAAMEIGIV